MYRKKDGQASLPELGKAGFKMFQSLLENLNIKLGTRHNTLYGARAMTNMLVIMAKNNVSANSAHKNGPPYIKIPSGDWLLKKLRPIEMDEMIQTCSKMIMRSANTADLQRHMRDCRTTRCTIAIDKHHESCYSNAYVYSIGNPG